MLFVLICFTIMYIRLNCIRLLDCTLQTRTLCCAKSGHGKMHCCSYCPHKPHKGKRLWLKISKPLPTLQFRVSVRRLREMCEWSGSHGRCPCPNSDKGFNWNTGYQNLIHFHRAGPRWGVDQDFFGELQKRGPACEAAQPDLCLCDSPYISRLIDDCAARRGSA